MREKFRWVVGKNCFVESLWKHSLGEVKLRRKKKNNSHMKLRLITWLIFLFLRAHVRLLYISTIIKQATPNVQIWAAGPPQVKMRNFALYEKIKAGWRARQGCWKQENSSRPIKVSHTDASNPTTFIVNVMAQKCYLSCCRIH